MQNPTRDWKLFLSGRLSKGCHLAWHFKLMNFFCAMKYPKSAWSFHHCLWYSEIIVNLSCGAPLSQPSTFFPYCSWVILPTDTWAAEWLAAHSSFGSYCIISIHIHFTWLFISKTALSKTDRLQISGPQWLTEFGHQPDCLGTGGSYKKKKSTCPHFDAH